MEGTEGTFGEIHILTELVYMDPNDLKTSTSSHESSVGGVVKLKKKPLSVLPVTVSTTVCDAHDVLQAWWPLKRFSGQLLGSVFASHAELIILLQEHNSDYESFIEYRPYLGGVLFIPYWQLVSIVHISDATLMVTLTLRTHHQHSSPSRRFSKESTITTHDFLIGPTRAVELEIILLELRATSYFRLSLFHLLPILHRNEEHLIEKCFEESISIFSTLESNISDSIKQIKRSKADDQCHKATPDENILMSITQRKHIKAMLYINILRRKTCELLSSWISPDRLEYIEEGKQDGTALRDSRRSRLASKYGTRESEVRLRVEEELALMNKEMPLNLNDMERVSSQVEIIVRSASKALRTFFLCTTGKLTHVGIYTLYITSSY